VLGELAGELLVVPGMPGAGAGLVGLQGCSTLSYEPM
jgi:hypothetical protein